MSFDCKSFGYGGLITRLNGCRKTESQPKCRNEQSGSPRSNGCAGGDTSTPPPRQTSGSLTEDKIPKLGMQFPCLDEAGQFFAAYAELVGFSFVTKSTRGSWKKWVCERSGFYKPKLRKDGTRGATKRMGCKVSVNVKCIGSHLWEISVLVLDHNHPTSPFHSRYKRINRQLGVSVKRQVLINDAAGIGPKKSHMTLLAGNGGHGNLAPLQKDIRNFVDASRRRSWGVDDAQSMRAYFGRMKELDKGFYHEYRKDEDGVLTDVFWCDGRSRAAGKEFGDVIVFDTTYGKNKYNMAFGPFVGVNHHGHTTLLGAGLLSVEDGPSFEWLFKEWVKCMGGVQPQGILTDQCKGIRKGVELALPDARHRLCLWHIMNKVPEKLGRQKEYDTIRKEMGSLIYGGGNASCFEEGWQAWLQRHGLLSHRWLKEMYKIRHHWVPSFFRDNFWAGMTTTQRSEGVNFYFQDYVNRQSSLRGFIQQFHNALETKIAREDLEDWKCSTTVMPLATSLQLEKIFHETYTHTKLRDFQK